MWHHSRKIFWNLIQARQVTVGQLRRATWTGCRNWIGCLFAMKLSFGPSLVMYSGSKCCFLLWSESSVWAPNAIQVEFHYIFWVISKKVYPLLSGKKKSDRQTPSQWIYWTLEHPFLQGKPIVFFSFWIPLGVIYREKCVSFRSCRVLTRYWHGDYLCLCHPFYPNPTCHSLCPLRRNHWMGRMCSWCLLLKFRMNFLLSLVARCH